jgi:uncharacterized protein YqeY
MTLKERISDDMKNAMRAKDTARLGTIRLLQAAMKQKEVDERVTLDDAAVIAAGLKYYANVSEKCAQALREMEGVA